MFEVGQKNIIDGFISVFVLLLIIFGNFLGELMPCKVREALSENMVLKHFLGYLTLLFFAVITIYEETTFTIIFSSLIVYIYFLFLSKVYYKLWIAIVFLLGVTYFLHIYKGALNENNKDNYGEDNMFFSVEFSKKFLDNIHFIQIILISISVIFTFIGFIYYYIAKKSEYGKSFSTLTFFLGKPRCRNSNKKIK